jgi:ribosomal protein S27AE
MNFKETRDKPVDVKMVPVLKSTERDCPRCDAILNQNEKEECYECLKCGYIDCGGK